MKEALSPPSAPTPIGPYSPIVRASGELFFFSGQIALDSGGNLVGTTIAEQTDRVCRNIATLLESVGLTFDNVVKTTVFLRSMNDFAEMNAVYERYFGASKPARSTVEVSGLPKGALVEIEVVAVR
ncbi:MAG: Rid family detoxifying hydrolase [Chlorobi bacterium]|jgi:2-iminobutanoate/2-iminopropanoate deaminase|nr:Rid family detoxifying hydrolase [Chlorobiota bacterium]